MLLGANTRSPPLGANTGQGQHWSGPTLLRPKAAGHLERERQRLLARRLQSAEPRCELYVLLTKGPRLAGQSSLYLHVLLAHPLAQHALGLAVRRLRRLHTHQLACGRRPWGS